MNRKIIVIGLIVIAVILGAIYFSNAPIKEDPLNFRGTSQSKTLYYEKIQSGSSVSFDGTNDYVVIEGDPGATYASVSIGDVVTFGSAGTIGGGLTEGTHYFVIKGVSTTQFQISETYGGTAFNLASGDGSNWMYEELGERSNQDVKECAYFTISLDAEETPSVAFKFQGSIQATEPEWYASQSRTNQWEYIDVYDAEDDTEVEGDTGIANSAGVDVHRLFYVSTNILNWINVKSETFASGSATILLMCGD